MRAAAAIQTIQQPEFVCFLAFRLCTLISQPLYVCHFCLLLTELLLVHWVLVGVCDRLKWKWCVWCTHTHVKSSDKKKRKSMEIRWYKENLCEFVEILWLLKIVQFHCDVFQAFESHYGSFNRAAQNSICCVYIFFSPFFMTTKSECVHVRMRR